MDGVLAISGPAPDKAVRFGWLKLDVHEPLPQVEVLVEYRSCTCSGDVTDPTSVSQGVLDRAL